MVLRKTHDEDFRFNNKSAIIRRSLFFASVVIVSALGVWALSYALSGDGLTTLEIILLAIFGINFSWITLSFMTGLVGVALRLLRLDPVRLRPFPDWPKARDITLSSRTVIVIPVYNEDPSRVFAGLKATWRSLSETGKLEYFDFFVLSDTRDPDIWIAEELLWAETCEDLDAVGRIFYRRRENNVERKSGNLKDFCEKWGGAYDFMLVFDADSVMAGEAIVRLAKHMEMTPDAGIIHSPPSPFGRETLFARILQFISRVHGPAMARGLAFWQLGSGNYWGHNAIIRTKAFLECCGLPVLSGKPPLGGPILSHDFVEAALMRRGGWTVWMAPDIEGSWEELPPNVIDYAIRDRRWCQGNLQHARILFARGLKPLSRLHLFMGVMSFLSSPFWLLLLLASTATAIETTRAGTSFFSEGAALFPTWPVDRQAELLTLLAVTLGMLAVPKIFSLMVVMFRRAKIYGGIPGLLGALVGELVFSALLAPQMMLLHTQFVVSILMGRAVGWEAQVRGDKVVPLSSAFAVHKVHILIGLGWGALALYATASFFWWMLPVLLGLVLSPFLTHVTSKVSWGVGARYRGLFVTPEEVAASGELLYLQEELDQTKDFDPDEGLHRLIEDPFASALHAALLPESAPDPRLVTEVSLIYEKLERLGASSLTSREKTLLLSYPVRPLDQVRAGREDSNTWPQSGMK